MFLEMVGVNFRQEPNRENAVWSVPPVFLNFKLF